MCAEQAFELLWQYVPVRIIYIQFTKIILLVWIFLVLSEALISNVEVFAVVKAIALNKPV